MRGRKCKSARFTYTARRTVYRIISHETPRNRTSQVLTTTSSDWNFFPVVLSGRANGPPDFSAVRDDGTPRRATILSFARVTPQTRSGSGRTDRGGNADGPDGESSDRSRDVRARVKARDVLFLVDGQTYGKRRRKRPVRPRARFTRFSPTEKSRRSTGTAVTTTRALFRPARTHFRRNSLLDELLPVLLPARFECTWIFMFCVDLIYGNKTMEILYVFFFIRNI